ncbi:hypothetical protein [Shimia marina]|uniref:Lipoprotein n=1 Tax=Shimia marina TaxID=321267 RepID=A0A0P1ERW6_9RHOB|nr:hypothetical protein [Shimia marina]CUH53247.1 hypothetical protein SHM7688_02700 [Shimia marina]SFD81611.1 hypothetical protein SAMN04488037_102573 [Shimia marina]
MKRWGLGLALSCVALAGCLSSEGFVTSSGVRVNPVNADVFEVAARPGQGVSDFWCGAGDYAWRALGAADNERVYVVGGAGPGVTSDSKDTMQFSLKQPGDVQGATGRQGKWGPHVGRNYFVGDARHQCNQMFRRFLP